MATVTRIKEREDGSAEVTLDLTDEEVGILLNDAITRALKNYLMFEALKEIDDE